MRGIAALRSCSFIDKIKEMMVIFRYTTELTGASLLYASDNQGWAYKLFKTVGKENLVISSLWHYCSVML